MDFWTRAWLSFDNTASKSIRRRCCIVGRSRKCERKEGGGKCGSRKLGIGDERAFVCALRARTERGSVFRRRRAMRFINFLRVDEVGEDHLIFCPRSGKSVPLSGMTRFPRVLFYGE